VKVTLVSEWDRAFCEAARIAVRRHYEKFKREEPERRERFLAMVDWMTNPAHEAEKARRRSAAREREEYRETLMKSPDLGALRGRDD